MVLTELRPGEAAFIEEVRIEGRLGRRLLALGFVPGTAVRVCRRAPLGDPTEYELRGTRLCLRSSEAKQIHVCRRTRES
ncbi:MAG: ferrous iron transport protein A [Planctomycetota bacterium]